MGHFAKSFGLKDEPTSFARKHSKPKAAPPTNRLTYTERDPDKMKAERRAHNDNKKKPRFATTVRNEVRNVNLPAAGSNRETGSGLAGPNRLMKMLPNSLALTTSEFGSGLPAFKKPKLKLDSFE